MPICPHCGKEYRKGGTFTTHVQNCDARGEGAEKAADGGAVDMEKEVETLRARLERVEQQAVNTPSNQKVNTARDDAERAMENVGTLRDDLDRLRRRLDELQEEVDSMAITCGECDQIISMPWREPRTCSNCGERLAWDALEEKMR